MSGFRVQVLYLRSSSSPDTYATNLNAIRTWAAGADAILRESSSAAGQEMGFTFVMTDDCLIDVDNVAISSSAIRTFDTSIMALDQQGYDQVDRIYLMFGDTNAAGICGIGTMWDDDRAVATNANNRGPSYARADRTCWNAHTAAHEGIIAVHTIVGDPDVHAMDYEKQPQATYCRPEIASIGITEAQATRGAEVLNKVIDTDEGARRLGEVALVADDSPISNMGPASYTHLTLTTNYSV